MNYIIFFLKPRPHLQSVSYILRLFDVSPNFPLTTSETMCDYYNYGIYELPYQLPNDLRLTILRKLGNIKKLPKLQRMIA